MNNIQLDVGSGAWLSHDLSVVRERFRLKSPYGHFADRLEIEARRFLFLSAKYNNQCAPSPLVDEFWHAMILNTPLYRDYCHAAFGRFLEHVVDIPSDRRADAHTTAYANTLQAYRENFGSPSTDIWPIKMTSKTALEKYAKPHRLHLETTNHCNLHCEHCYPSSSHLNPHHDRATLTKVFNEAKRKGVGKITLTGGEFLTRPDWKEVIQEALGICDNLYFISNGVLLSDSKLRWLAKQRAWRTLKKWLSGSFGRGQVDIGVAISLDGLAGNELVRKNAAGKSVKATEILKRIERACDYGLHVTVNTTITNSVSARELGEMYDILSKLPIDRWQLDQAYSAGRFLDSDLRHEGLTWLEDAKEGYKYIVSNYLKDWPKLPNWRLEIVQVFRYDTLFSGFRPAASLDEHPCSYHFGSVIVEEGDKVRFCPSLRDAGIGRLSESGSFDNIYSGNEAFDKFLQGSINDLSCRNCRYGKLFHGGCRANSLSYSGKLWDRDPICCSLSPFVEDEIVPLLPSGLRENFLASLQGGLRPDQEGHPAEGIKSQAKDVKRIIPISAG